MLTGQSSGMTAGLMEKEEVYSSFLSACFSLLAGASQNLVNSDSYDIRGKQN